MSDTVTGLLIAAGLQADHPEARRWLEIAIHHLQPIDGAVTSLPISDSNARLDEIAKLATKLTGKIESLRGQGYGPAYHDFWDFDGFGPIHNSQYERDEVVGAVRNIAEAARAARREQTGRTPKIRKQRIFDAAARFYAKFADKRPTMGNDSPFSRFARSFYEAVTSTDSHSDSDHQRQIESAVSRLKKSTKLS